MNVWLNVCVCVCECVSECELASGASVVSEWVWSEWVRVNEWVKEWVSERVSERVGGYKIDFSKFKWSFNYCTAIQTNKVKDGQNMFWLELVYFFLFFFFFFFSKIIITTKSYT